MAIADTLASIQRTFSQMGAGVQEETPEGPYTPASTLGEGVLTFWDESGNFNAIPYTRTPPIIQTQDQNKHVIPGETPLETSEYGVEPSGAYGGQVSEYEQPREGRNAQAIGWEAIEGVGQPRGYDIGEWVNPSNPGVPNLGPVNQQAYQDSTTIHRRFVPSQEQGHALDPAILNPRYPHSENVNPFYQAWGQYRRNGVFHWNPENLPYGSFAALNWELQYMGYKQASTVHGKLVDIPPSVPFSATVPVGGQAGPFELVPAGDEAIY